MRLSLMYRKLNVIHWATSASDGIFSEELWTTLRLPWNGTFGVDPSKTGNLFAQDGDGFDRGDLMGPIKAVCKSLCKERLISIFKKKTKGLLALLLSPTWAQQCKWTLRVFIFTRLIKSDVLIGSLYRKLRIHKTNFHQISRSSTWMSTYIVEKHNEYTTIKIGMYKYKC